jgi:hypothetical protein
LFEQGCWRPPKKAFRRRGSVRAPDKIVVQRRERGEFSVSESMVTMVMQGELTIAAFDTGTAALKQVGTVRRDLFEVLALGHGKRLERMLRLVQRRQSLGA